MAKTAAKKTTGREVATSTSGVPAELATRMSQDVGKGVSSRQEDNLVPLIYILQKGSPQVNKKEEVYIAGAEAGNIWLRNMPEPLVFGDEGILVQPCYFAKDWVEWVPRDDGGGFVGRHESLPEDAKLVKDDKNPNKQRYVRPNGNEVIETRYHMLLVHGRGPVPLPFVLPLSSTGHTFSRQWMFMMNQRKIKDGIAPSWAGLYRLRTQWKKNAIGDWFAWSVTDEGWVPTVENYDMGSALHEAFASGAKQAEAPVEHRDDAADAAARAGL